MSTCCELSVCATKLGTLGIVFGVTVITLTWGGGRSGRGASLEHAASATAAKNSVNRRKCISDSLFNGVRLEFLLLIKSGPVQDIFIHDGKRARAARNTVPSR